MGHVSFYKILIKDLELRLNVIVTMNKKYHNAPWKIIKRKCRNERVGEGGGGGAGGGGGGGGGWVAVGRTLV